MEFKNANLRLVKLPADIDLMLFLIQEELKSTKLFNGLAHIGLSDCYYQSHFGTVILASAGFHERPDDLHEFYIDLINKRSKKIKADNDSVTKQALKVYIDLMNEKRKRLEKNR